MAGKFGIVPVAIQSAICLPVQVAVLTPLPWYP
jgi:hypothetical protein